MSAELDIYVATSGPFRLGFAAAQVDSSGPCPSFDARDPEQRPGVLGVHEGMQVVHPGWFWGQVEAQQLPECLLVVRTGVCALAVDSCRLRRLAVEPPPAVLAGSGIVFGVVDAGEGLVPILDLARVPLA
jgi:hypothetical protein